MGACASLPTPAPTSPPTTSACSPCVTTSGAAGCSSTSTAAAEPFEDHVGDLAALTAPWATSELVVGATHHYELAANWKVAIENYHECYHCPLIHPELCRVSPSTSGANIAERRGAFVGGAMDLADGAVTMSLSGDSPLTPLPGLDGERRRQVLYVQLLPNLLLSLHPDYVMTHRITPVTPTTSAVECQWLFAADAVGAPGLRPQLCRRLLGPDQPSGLGGRGVRAARPRFVSLRARRVRPERGCRPPLRVDDRRRLPGQRLTQRRLVS